jgi:hypothetical protein
MRLGLLLTAPFLVALSACNETLPLAPPVTEHVAVTILSPDGPYVIGPHLEVSPRDGGFRVQVSAPLGCRSGIDGGVRRRGADIDVVIGFVPYDGACTTGLAVAIHQVDVPALAGPYRVWLYVGTIPSPPLLGMKRVIVR